MEFHFDYGSPYAYLGWQRIRTYAERYADHDIEWIPVSAGHLFRADGTAPNVTFPNQEAYLWTDCRRWAEHYGVPFDPPREGPAAMPINSIKAARMHFLARADGVEEAWMEAVWSAYFRDGLDIHDDAVLDRLAEAVGLTAGAEAAQEDAYKKALVASTQHAYELGAPGVPFVVYDGEPFWGQDRLAWVEAKIAGRPFSD